MSDDRTYTLVVSCPDRVGIVAAVSAFIAGHKGWILESNYHADRSTQRFFMRNTVVAGSLPFGIDEFRRRFEPIAAEFAMDWRITDSAVKPRVVLLCSKQDHCLVDLLHRWRARDFVFDGFTTELSLKLSADVSDHIAAQVKTCYGCHGFEIGAAYVDFRPTDDLTVRAGRFVPAFGDFQARHDPANHATSDKPMPYDMGRMLRLRDWNMSVLPAPYVDSGLQLTWAPRVTECMDLELDAYIVGGLRGQNDATDVERKIVEAYVELELARRAAR